MPLGINGTSGTAPGSRNHKTGELKDVGYSDASWSSATNGIGGLSMTFSTKWFHISNPDYRAYGFQLRCLSE
ncbi:hypothetical protein [uncultured Rikenella sp.]|uniref:hypothetical protein n=1 Tax=uncultured Rikenella sp. TaxID=368003 RepID=UPI0026373291|nr:hypothetical protein [uncultured Rikenella sp.]